MTTLLPIGGLIGGMLPSVEMGGTMLVPESNPGAASATNAPPAPERSGPPGRNFESPPQATIALTAQPPTSVAYRCVLDIPTDRPMCGFRSRDHETVL
jgi:hypothetical protein